jgi:hypothetical protein
MALLPEPRDRFDFDPLKKRKPVVTTPARPDLTGRGTGQSAVSFTPGPGPDITKSPIRRPSASPLLAPATTEAEADPFFKPAAARPQAVTKPQVSAEQQVDAEQAASAGPRIIREPGKTPLLTNVGGSREDIVGGGTRNFVRSDNTGKEFQLGDVESITKDDFGQGQAITRRSLIDARGGVDRLEGKVIDVGGGQGGTLANFITSRNQNRAERRTAKALQERSNKLELQQQEAGFEQQAAERERQGETFTVSPGEKVVSRGGETIAEGGELPAGQAKQIKFLPEIQAAFQTDDGFGNKTFDSAGLAEFEGFIKDNKFKSQREAFTAYQGEVSAQVGKRASQLKSQFPSQEAAKAAIEAQILKTPGSESKLRSILAKAYPQ